MAEFWENVSYKPTTTGEVGALWWCGISGYCMQCALCTEGL